MGRTRFYIASTLIVLTSAFAGRRDDPLDEVVEALAQGRHWYATRLLRDLDGADRRSPEAELLAARADAGRGAWAEVTRRLQSAVWLDSIAFGEGRTLLARAWLETGHPRRAAENYRIFLGYSVERTPRTLSEIGLARALESMGEGRAAAAVYMRATEIAPELAPWSAIRAAESLAPSGDTAGVRRHLDRADGVPSWRRTLAAVTAYQAAGDPDGALRLLLDAADRRAARKYSADLRTRAARILLERGDTAAARGTLRSALRRTPGSAREAADLLLTLPGLRVSDHLRSARAYEKSGVPERAAQEYRRYLELARVSRGERQRIRLKIGELSFRAGLYAAAIDEFERLINSKPARSIKVRAEYLAARATYRQGRRTEGRVALREIADKYPGTGSAINALSMLGDLYESAGDIARARGIYRELADRYPWTRAAGRAQFRLGIIAFLDGDYDGARQHFDRCRRRHRGSDLRIKATYWSARARMADGRPNRAAEARKLFREVHARDPFGYYGLLAAERLGIDPWAALPSGPEPFPIDQETQHKFALIDLLRQAGLKEEAKTILESVVAARPNRPEEMIGLSVALAEHGFGGEAVRFGWRAHARLRGRWSVNVLRAIYPLAYPEIILAESRNTRLNPHLLAAIVRQESAFAPDATSRAGARGLLQLMPETGRWWASRLGVGNYDDDLLFHPEINVHIGAAYFANLQRRYRELQIALVAYNAGPDRASRWRRRPAYRIDSELFAERIPISETRRYVRGVQTQLRIYRQLYSDFGFTAPAE